MSDPTSAPTPAPPPVASENSVGQFFGALLMAVGVLWMFLCGACTLFFIVSGAVQGLRATADNRADDVPLMIMFGIIGLVGAVPGFGMFVIGRLIRRRR